MRLVCISAAHTPYNGALMERSAKRVGVEIVRFKQGEPWPNDYRVGKLVHGLECVRTLPDDVTHVMFVDSSDSLFLANPEEIVAKFDAIAGERPTSVLIQGEKNCYPDKSIESQYPPQRTPWHFVNSGGWIARRDSALFAMPLVATFAEYCDQLAWSLAYLRGASGDPMTGSYVPIEVDENCQIFQSMYLQKPGEFKLDNGRLYNLKTAGRPCVAHWNGTRNEGRPFSRAGIWSCLDLLSASCLPTGNEVHA